MKSRGRGGRTRFGVDGRTRDGVTALVGIALVTVAAFGACNLDDKNPPLPNEAPNRGQFVGGIAIGAGPGGTGGSGAGLGSSGSGGSTTTTVTPGDECACMAAYNDTVNTPQCKQCFNQVNGGACLSENDNCMADSTMVCSDDLGSVIACGTDPNCLDGNLPTADALLDMYLLCACANCATQCAHQAITCN